MDQFHDALHSNTSDPGFWSDQFIFDPEEPTEIIPIKVFNLCPHEVDLRGHLNEKLSYPPSGSIMRHFATSDFDVFRHKVTQPFCEFKRKGQSLIVFHPDYIFKEINNSRNYGFHIVIIVSKRVGKYLRSKKFRPFGDGVTVVGPMSEGGKANDNANGVKEMRVYFNALEE